MKHIVKPVKLSFLSENFWHLPHHKNMKCKSLIIFQISTRKWTHRWSFARFRFRIFSQLSNFNSHKVLHKCFYVHLNGSTCLTDSSLKYFRSYSWNPNLYFWNSSLDSQHIFHLVLYTTQYSTIFIKYKQ